MFDITSGVELQQEIKCPDCGKTFMCAYSKMHGAVKCQNPKCGKAIDLTQLGILGQMVEAQYRRAHSERLNPQDS